MQLLECDRVSKHYGSLVAVDQLSFTLAQGEVLGIGGPNGAGKTTLFDLISGMSPATSGSVVLKGRDITRLAPQQVCHAGIARTFQLNAGFDTLSALDNVIIGSHFGRSSRLWPGVRVSQAVKDAAWQALEAVGLTGRAHHTTSSLTVLDRKLLMLASALVTQPSLLLLDEPAGGLTDAEMEQLMEVLQGVRRRGISMVLIEHVMRFLVQLSDRVMIMHHGEKIFVGPPSQLASDARVVEVYLGHGAAQRMSAGGAADAHGAPSHA